MPLPKESDRIRAFLESLGANEGYAEELFQAFTSNSEAVPEPWRSTFRSLLPGAGTTEISGNGGSATFAGVGSQRPATAAMPAATTSAPALAATRVAAQEGDRIQPLRGAALRVAINMGASLAVPTATSQRSIPVRLLDENRRLLNAYLQQRQLKVSFTHLIGWAVVRALEHSPVINSAFAEDESGAPARVERAHVNLGLAADVEMRGGSRTLLVPVIKRADGMNFQQFLLESERLVQGARQGRISPEDLQSATITLTNPGTLGTRASVPRLMPGQGAIIAAGAVAYPSGFEGMQESTLYSLGVGKVINISCTYDHRVIQGAESGAFLARINDLLLGASEFYEHLFADLNVPFKPAHWSVDAAPATALLPGTGREQIEQIRKQAAVLQIVHAYRVRGHLLADVDPLGFNPIQHPELEPDYYGLTLWDLDRRFLSSIYDGPSDGGAQKEMAPLREILQILRATYCGTLACEFMHIQSLEQRQWLQRQMEPSRNNWPLAAELRGRILVKLTKAEVFERLLHTRFVGHKRFSLEGAEGLIPSLDHLLNLHADAGGAEVLIGMAHRGRLNVLTNITGKPMNEMFLKFEDIDPESVEGSGDVKYHLGADGVHVAPSGRELPVSVVPNPSHLEAVDPVLEGSARARQELIGDAEGERVLPILIHGDAAFAGQGVVAETLNLSELAGYRTGGTVHFIVNNRIGFTTSPAGARSTLYSTDVARMVQAPIFHVNGDDPDALVRAVELAFRFRREFSKDVVIDIVCYRRHGHNEGDDPSLTQPVLYRSIDEHKTVRALYGARLEREGAMAGGEAEALMKRLYDEMSAATEATVQEPVAEMATSGSGGKRAIVPRREADEVLLAAAGGALQRIPANFHVHPKLKTFLDRRTHAIETRGAVDWSLGEALAFGSLLAAGIPIRISGQDTARGTFSQRHSVLYDYETGTEYIPLQHISTEQAPFMVYDSLLSEEAALGFEFGYSMTHPEALVLWEAQFGDFANGAQVVIDQFIAASESKWHRTSGLVLLLPHGYEGQGPEHSSARPERFLQLCAENNLIVTNCTNAAQYYHLLRRQALEFESRRPLVIFTPKSLLRLPEAASPFAELVNGQFHPMLADAEADPERTKRVILCTGKIYYDLLRARKRGPEGAATALLRIEQLYPLPERELREQIGRYRGAADWLWVQEEPMNMGAWNYMNAALDALTPQALRYVGREASASPATGSLRRHQKEQQAILAEALTAARLAAD